jgi:hypothetical protein
MRVAILCHLNFSSLMLQKLISQNLHDSVIHIFRAGAKAFTDMLHDDGIAPFYPFWHMYLGPYVGWVTEACQALLPPCLNLLHQPETAVQWKHLSPYTCFISE